MIYQGVIINSQRNKLSINCQIRYGTRGISDQINSMSLHSRPVCFCFMVVKMNTNKFMSSTSKVFCFSE